MKDRLVVFNNVHINSEYMKDITGVNLQEPCSGAMGGGGTGSADKQGEFPCDDDTSKWTELHTDYIYTQDFKHP
jgi:hypothetical protein